MRFPYLSGDGAEICAVTTMHLWKNVHGISLKKVKETSSAIDPSVWLPLIRSAQAYLSKAGAQTLLYRLVKETGAEEISRLLPSAGFVKKHERVEYRRSIAELPGEGDSPLVWKNMTDAAWSLERTAAFLERVATGDPDFDPSESAADFMQDWLKDPELTCGPHCVEIGFLEEEPVALVVAQVNPNSKWSRISYMGILPAWRGQGLGRWVHRRGFARMRAQGGALYHGGTHAENRAMRKLFEGHGCALFQEMEEWAYRFPAPSPGKVVQISSGKAQLCERILRALPEWFGIEEAIQSYVRAVEAMPMLVAVDQDRPVGFLSLHAHNEHTAEIHVMGILPSHHRAGLGRELCGQAERYLRERGFAFLTVKTLSPARPLPAYAKTRSFYLAQGFLPVEEFKNLWGEANPCLLMVKRL